MNTKIIGDKIATARKKLGLSQAQLAEQLFISAQAVGKWERGESMPDIITLNRLKEIVGVDLNYFSDEKKVVAEASLDGSVDQQAGLSSNENKAPGWDMSGGNWVDADFSGLKNLNDKFSFSNMQRCKFVGADLSGLKLKGNHVVDCDFSDTDISDSHLEGSHLVGNKLINCSLKGTELKGNHIKDCNFSGATLSKAVFKGCDFSKNTITDAEWNGTSFMATNITNTVFEGRLENCSFEHCSFKNVTFQNATLINCFFKCKSLKRIRFIGCEADRMTYEFLKNGKADLSGITMVTP